MKVSDFFDMITGFGKKNAPALLAATAMLGLAASVYSAWKAAPKAKDILDNRKERLSRIDPKNQEKRKQINGETAKELVPVVAPMAITTAVTAACIFGSNSVSSKRIKLLTAGYTLANQSLKELNEKMRATLGDKKADQVKDAIKKDKLKKAEEKNPNLWEETGRASTGDVRCIDGYTGAPFWSTAQKIGQAVNKLSAECRNSMWVSLNDLYYELGLDPIRMGNDLGWNVEDEVEGMLPISYSAILNANHEPCICVDYDVSIRRDLRGLH